MRTQALYGRAGTEFDHILDLAAPVPTTATIVFRARARGAGADAISRPLSPVLAAAGDTTAISWRVTVPAATMAALDPTARYAYRVVAGDGGEQAAGPFYVDREWP